MSTVHGELNFSSTIIESLAELHLNPNRSDVVFVVAGEKLPAHKFILSLRSYYFQALIDGSFAESTQSEIELKVPLNAFKRVLRYIYTGFVSLQDMDKETVLEMLSLSDEYSIDELKSGITTYLKENLSTKNCCAALDAACLYESKELKKAALNYLGRNSKAVFHSADFKTLTVASLRALLKHSTIFVPEIEIINAVLQWREHNPDVPDDDFQTIVSAIRFELVEWDHLVSTVKESSILSEKQLLDVMALKTFTKNPNYRSDCKPDVNIATAKLNAKVVNGSEPLELLNGNVSEYSIDKGYTHHKISASDIDFIAVELDHIFMLNQLDLLLLDTDDRSYSYYIEVSTDQEQWRRVIDHTKCFCRSLQILRFEPQPVRYIKIVGTKNTVGNTFQAVHLAAYYKSKQPALINGLLSPTINVASKDCGAKVINGTCRENETVDILLNGNAVNYTPTSGFVKHIIGSGSIVIQLGQPFHIGSVRLLLWDCFIDRRYSFYIETSTNQTDWKMAVDKRNERLGSWQEFSFDCRPVVFFRIIGTFNSDPNNLGFHLVHFESPIMKDMDYVKPKRQQL